MDKTINRKSCRIHGDKRGRIGTPTGILAFDNTELLVGDYISYYGEKCIVLFNTYTQKYEAMLCRSCWYNDRKPFEADSYGKSYSLPTDNGAKIHIHRI